MVKKFINVLVDERPVKVQLGYTIMQTCSQAGIEMPRFCYHDKLLIAGNCRICLVEVVGSKKLVASCAIHATDNMSIYTNTVRVRVARQNVLEFLLANHPLDCPICDQGGECDLQDITAVFGADRGRFYEFEKRAVLNKDFGPLIRTSMNRCIHCTRCVRFLTFSSGLSVLGTLGRGSSTEIGVYINQFIHDELSGNITDLCPVGALTSKPYSFRARPWELVSVEGVDVFDSVNANLLFDVAANKISRVLPYSNEAVNECWITNRARYAYDGLFVQRLSSCLLKSTFSFLNGGAVLIKKVTNFFVKISWSEAFLIFFEKLLNTKISNFFSYVGGLTDLESVISGRVFFNLLGAVGVTYRIQDFAVSSDFNFLYYFNTTLNKLSKLPTFCLLLGINTRFESPLLNLRLVRLVLDYGVPIYKIGISAHYSTFRVRHLSSNIRTFFEICEFKHNFCKNFYLPNFILKPFVIVGQSASDKFTGGGLSSALLNFAGRVISLRKFFSLSRFSISEFLMFGFVSNYSGRLHILDGGFASILKFTRITSLNVALFSKYFSGSSVLYSLGNDESTAFLPTTSIIGNLWSVYQGTHGVGLARVANLVFPTVSHVEKSAVFVNLMGLVQRSAAVVSYDIGAKSDVEVFRGLLSIFLRGFFNAFTGFNYYLGVYFNLDLTAGLNHLGEAKFLFSDARLVSTRICSVRSFAVVANYLLLGGFFLKTTWFTGARSNLRLVYDLGGFGFSRIAVKHTATAIMNYYGDAAMPVLASSKTMSLCSNLYVKKNFSFSHLFL